MSMSGLSPVDGDLADELRVRREHRAEAPVAGRLARPARTRPGGAGPGCGHRRRRRPARRSAGRASTRRVEQRPDRPSRDSQRLVAEHDEDRLDVGTERLDPDLQRARQAASPGRDSGPGARHRHAMAASMASASSPSTTTDSSRPASASRSRTCWRIGRPSIVASSLPPPNRDPAPAASTIATTRSGLLTSRMLGDAPALRRTRSLPPAAAPRYRVHRPDDARAQIERRARERDRSMTDETDPAPASRRHRRADDDRRSRRRRRCRASRAPRSRRCGRGSDRPAS